MKSTPQAPRRRRGTTLLEAVIATSTLAVAIPLVFGAFAESGKSGISAEAETRSTWIVPACMAEIQAAREGKSQFLDPSPAGTPFGGTDGVVALAFSQEGQLIGKLNSSEYERGVKTVNGLPVRYIASLNATLPNTSNSASTPANPLLLTKVTLEYPSASVLRRRQNIDFYSQIP